MEASGIEDPQVYALLETAAANADAESLLSDSERTNAGDPNRRSCICHNGHACQIMSTAFAVIKDPRGDFVKVPSSSTPLRKIYHRYLRPNEEYFDPNEWLEDDEEESVEEFDFVVAMHHFHPKVIDQYFNTSTMFRLEENLLPLPLRTMSSKDREFFGMSLGSEDRVLSRFTRKPTDQFYVVPSYSFDLAHIDLRQAMTHMRRLELDQCVRRMRREARRQKWESIVNQWEKTNKCCETRANDIPAIVEHSTPCSSSSADSLLGTRPSSKKLPSSSLDCGGNQLDGKRSSWSAQEVLESELDGGESVPDLSTSSLEGHESSDSDEQESSDAAPPKEHGILKEDDNSTSSLSDDAGGLSDGPETGEYLFAGDVSSPQSHEKVQEAATLGAEEATNSSVQLCNNVALASEATTDSLQGAADGSVTEMEIGREGILKRWKRLPCLVEEREGEEAMDVAFEENEDSCEDVSDEVTLVSPNVAGVEDSHILKENLGLATATSMELCEQNCMQMENSQRTSHHGRLNDANPGGKVISDPDSPEHIAENNCLYSKNQSRLTDVESSKGGNLPSPLPGDYHSTTCFNGETNRTEGPENDPFPDTASVNDTEDESILEVEPLKRANNGTTECMVPATEGDSLGSDKLKPLKPLSVASAVLQKTNQAVAKKSTQISQRLADALFVSIYLGFLGFALFNASHCVQALYSRETGLN